MSCSLRMWVESGIMVCFLQVYKKPLEKLAEGSTPILDREQVKTLFGTVEDIVHHHELFYSALLSRTLDWHIQQKIGDIFMSSVSIVTLQ